MKFILACFLFTLSASSFAAAQLTCSAEDGSAIQATVDAQNNVYDVMIKYRSSKEFKRVFRGMGTALTTTKTRDGEKVKTLVITSEKRIVVAIAAGTYVDETGSYSLDNCEISF